MRDMIAYERSGGRSGGYAAAAVRLRALLSGMRAFVVALTEEIRRIPDYSDQAEALRQGLRRAHSNRRERDGRGISG